MTEKYTTEESSDDDEEDPEFENVVENPTDENFDVSASYIRVLTSVVFHAVSIQGTVSFNYVRDRLYADKKDDMPLNALKISADIINSLRQITLKQDQFKHIRIQQRSFFL
ncbi:hypothetical protein [Parasitella parasitica]|uniref:Uncharacterized protein n=1 Tax=Parasitella parasitica TaxID=35722 RepID=A0A0B7MVP2_9FUNG|nr:hypothetical protein [Parasitella parasitica]